MEWWQRASPRVEMPGSIWCRGDGVVMEVEWKMEGEDGDEADIDGRAGVDGWQLECGAVGEMDMGGEKVETDCGEPANGRVPSGEDGGGAVDTTVGE